LDFSFTKKQIEFKQKVIDFATSAFDKDHVDADKNCSFSKEDWQKCADFGIQGLLIPKKYGGRNEDIDFLTAIYAMEGLGYGSNDNGLLFGINAQMWTVQLPLVQFGTTHQKKMILPELASGMSIACHALTEPDAGSDVFSMQTTATKVEGGYILNGHKRLITLGPIADFSLVFAVTNPAVGKWGLSAFFVKKGTPGYTTSANKPKMGMRTVPIGDLFFEDCFVSDENRLGKEGAGWSIINHSLEYDRCGVFASQLGAMERQLEASIAFVKKRKQYDKTIGEFQSVSNRIANMKLRLESSRLHLYRVAWLKSQNKSAVLESALLKLQISEDFVTSSMDAIRNQGGSAYLTENETERDLRDAIGGVIYAGTSDIQRNIISKLLGL